MRVISGKARGTRLKKVPGDSTRPIMDRVKENLFNILGDVSGERWLDLFAGTGQVGIEALSRGAGETVFVDKARPAILTIKDNLRAAKLEIGAQVIQDDAFAYLRREGERPFDLIYVAPPQYVNLWLQILQLLDEAPQKNMTEQGIVVVQIDPLEYIPQSLQRLELYDERRYGNTMLLFYDWR